MLRYITTLLAALALSATVPSHPAARAVPPASAPASASAPAGPPIWSHTAAPAAHEIVLFRRAFTAGATYAAAELRIFADTRYEVWLDGAWLGRGPARFSAQTREYDAYPLRNLAAGPHTLAALVQWAPNVRRSESTSPSLQARLLGHTATQWLALVETGPAWKAQLSTAWRQDAAPVHTWNLIGPTELLDLRKLPRDWTSPAFDDRAWPNAVSRIDSPAASSARSIPLLTAVITTPVLLDAGALAPGRAIVEIAPQMVPQMAPQPASSYAFTAGATSATTLTLERLSISSPPAPGDTRVDGADLTWQPAGANRPDVYVASAPLNAGQHQIVLANVPADGATFAIYTRSLQLPALPFSQGAHAGRRVLLAEPVSGHNFAALSSGARDGITLTFTHTPAYAVLALGRSVYGRLAADASGQAGTVVDAGWDERLSHGRPLPYPGSLHPEWNQVDSWVLDGQPRSITTIDARTGRYILVAVWGAGPVQLRNLRVIEERYPAQPAGRYESSDPDLNAIWRVSADTLTANLTDAYADPWRERGQWWGDTYMGYHTSQVLSDDTRVLRRGLLLMAEAITLSGGQPNALAPNGAGVHTLDFAMLWVHSLSDYYTLTRDAAVITSTYPALRSFMSYLAGYENPSATVTNPVTGLLTFPAEHWSQTVYIDTPAFSSRSGQSTAANALYYATLLKAADLATINADAQTAAAWRAKAALVRRQINTYLYLPDQHRYLSSLYEGRPVDPSPHAQAWPLAYGVVPEGEVQAVASSLLALLSPDPAAPNVQVYGLYWVAEGLARAGRTAEALDVIQRYYGRMLRLGATTWWEVFNADQNYWQSLSHGWGAWPAWFLSAEVLGARRDGPNTWLVQPDFAGLRAASGAIPLQSGLLQVQWQNEGCPRRHVEVSAPAGSSGVIVLTPINASAAITLGNQLVWSQGRARAAPASAQSGGVRISLPSGNYSLDVQQTCREARFPLLLR